MLANSLRLAAAYLIFGLALTCLARGGWAEDWDESLLASVLGPPLFTLIAAVVLARFLLDGSLGRHRPADLVSHFHRKRLADHRLARAADRPGLESDPGGTRS